MKLDCSCHCGAVKFSLESSSYVAYQHCYCSICVKCQGSGGSGVNIGGEKGSLKVEGEENISIYNARMTPVGDPNPKFSSAERTFCKKCGSHLWLFDKRWPELIHPSASAIDSDVPTPPVKTHIFLKYKPAWVCVDAGPDDLKVDEYPKESLAEWHERHGFS